MVPVTEQATFSEVGFNRLKADFQDLTLTVRDSLFNTGFYTGNSKMIISGGCQVFFLQLLLPLS